MDGRARGNHCGVSSGNPLSCAARVTTIDAILEEGMLANRERQGERFGPLLGGLQVEYRGVG